MSCLMDVLEHHPILTVIVDSFLILVGLGISFESRQPLPVYVPVKQHLLSESQGQR